MQPSFQQNRTFTGEIKHRSRGTETCEAQHTYYTTLASAVFSVLHTPGMGRVGLGCRSVLDRRHVRTIHLQRSRVKHRVPLISQCEHSIKSAPDRKGVLSGEAEAH